MLDWKPGASIEHLKARARLLEQIRLFFSGKNVLEVETPLLAPTTTTDVYIESFEVHNYSVNEQSAFFLQTSPEFAMKRLLAANSGAIYQICKAFRKGESSKRHNCEFSMLEWYQPGYSMSDLMEEVEELVSTLLDCGTITRLSYRELFQQYLTFDPHAISLETLKIRAEAEMDFSSDDLSKTDYLQMLLAKCIEPQMPKNCFVYDFPVEQAALAVIDLAGPGRF